MIFTAEGHECRYRVACYDDDIDDTLLCSLNPEDAEYLFSVDDPDRLKKNIAALSAIADRGIVAVPEEDGVSLFAIRDTIAAGRFVPADVSEGFRQIGGVVIPVAFKKRRATAFSRVVFADERRSEYFIAVSDNGWTAHPTFPFSEFRSMVQRLREFLAAPAIASLQPTSRLLVQLKTAFKLTPTAERRYYRARLLFDFREKTIEAVLPDYYGSDETIFKTADPSITVLDDQNLPDRIITAMSLLSTALSLMPIPEAFEVIKFGRLPIVRLRRSGEWVVFACMMTEEQRAQEVSDND